MGSKTHNQEKDLQHASSNTNWKQNRNKSAQDATQQICLPPLQVTVYCLHMHGLSFMNTT